MSKSMASSQLSAAPSSSKARLPPTPQERALAIKKLQEEALSRLPLDSLYIVLWIRADPPVSNDFHWGYYFHTAKLKGHKYHMKNMGHGWIADHGPTNGVFKSNFLCVLIQIASIPPEKKSLVDQIMRSRDGDVNSIPGMSCRVWVLTIAEKLSENGLVRYTSRDALEQECFRVGNQYSAAAAENTQPRPVVRSEVCH
ncbi:TPA_exp: Uncharacterized protein A8136_6201 [Trichophyton benhamiae CBS 112371]|uniref:Uncharacterized protein n=2 Tax=Trichophyton TaxID=5550 RepID=D4AQI4_ARTBC|nr:uncharacterized protein ARB_06491 [Trichophyton benhamiae CBS 112371]XP_003025256.1 uncharacterized protein TRV_00572 [Trichophyton verrucosum HKI 0517]EFE34728.1 hypothetical protein ARB_06491 [Trichophyton benhamiae CBS 112371]EFE44645.1 hypothetical protein TRV_00572 [Trichophyton verrucosum HKI 0517]DAA77655.1 TPA_exp: Uncharacterized protein A8136_6201 [Trichophyton benhamiae CBS 112371]